MNTTMMVKEFHERHGFTVGARLKKHLTQIGDDIATAQLLTAAALLRTISKQWENGSHCDSNELGFYDDRLMRPHLLVEELAEVLEALANRDEVQLLDGLADLDYVVHGTAVTYDLPLIQAIVEVHRSNMTKQVTGEGRLRDKGTSYEPPRLKEVLKLHRDNSR